MFNSVLVIVFGLLTVATAAPLDQLDQDKWSLVPDSNGHLHLVNLNPYSVPDQLEPEKLFIPAQDTIFRLYTRSNPLAPQVLVLNNADSISASDFNPSLQTRFIIHGWNNDGFSEVNTILTNAWLTRGDFNVITVDWGVGAQTINYIAARRRVQLRHIAGHSLGAHAAGNAGFYQQNRLNTIFGMDPALPLFSLESSDRIHDSDAQYVETIHTNAGLLGFDIPLGQASFYPNGGRTQPGCGIDITGACAHGRAYQFLAESIVSGGFTSIPCQNYQQILGNNCVINGPSRNMGGEPSNQAAGAHGVYTLSTRAASPFSMG
ncbi:hypothetical protein pipiens_005990 [Culex pipiens pipiens]|uniref:Lipase domain-containing protein n=1 Tax=Culex pipiens pipiens TaxID=38569 RepID=A0ABD1DSD5_CULPP